MTAIQIGVNQVKTCRRCGDGKVAWVTSTRTGKHYLAKVVTPYGGGMQALSHDPHKCHPDDVVAMTAAREADEANGIQFKF